MFFSDTIARIVLADARRFELETAAMLRDILRDCPDPAARKLVEEILAEEEAHAARLGEAHARVEAPAAAPAADRAAVPAPPATAAPRTSGVICDRLRDVLAKEEASVLFYSLLAKRTLIPSVRDLFHDIAEQERGHARKLADHIRAACEGA